MTSEGELQASAPTAKEASSSDAASLRKRLRDFGLLVGGILLLWGALRLYRGKTHGVVGLGTGGVLVLFGLLAPQVLRLPYRAWSAMGHVLGTINTRVLLFLTFWLVLVPLGLLRRLVSGSALAAQKQTTPEGKTTYWVAKKADERGSKHFENMF